MPRVKLDSNTLHFFVRFYWHLYYYGEEFAFQLLKKELEFRGRWYYPQGVGIKPNINLPGDYSRRHGRAVKNRKFKRLPEDTKPIKFDPPATPSSIQLNIISHANSPHANPQNIILPGSTKDKKQAVVVAKGRTIPQGHLSCDTSFASTKLTAKKKRTRPNRSKPLSSISTVEQTAGNSALLPSQSKNDPLDLGLDVKVSSPVKELVTEEQLILNAHPTGKSPYTKVVTQFKPSSESLISSSTYSNETPLSPPPSDSPPAVVMQEFTPSPLPTPHNPEGIFCQPPESNTLDLLVLDEEATPEKAGNAESACQIQDPLPDHPPIWAEVSPNPVW